MQVEKFAQSVQGFGRFRKSEGPREDAQFVVRDTQVISPKLAHLAHRAVIGGGSEKHADTKCVRPLIHERAQRVGAINAPVAGEPEASAHSIGCVVTLRLYGALQVRPRRRPEKRRVGQARMAVTVGADMPFALDMLPAQGMSLLIEKSRIIFDPHVIKPVRAAFKADLYDGAMGIEKQRRLLPEKTGLIGCSIAGDDNGLGHGQSSVKAALMSPYRRGSAV